MGDFIGIREEGGAGDKPWPEAAHSSWPYGSRNAAWAAFPRPLGGRARGASSRARGPFGPLSDSAPGFWFLALDFDESALLGQWLS